MSDGPACHGCKGSMSAQEWKAGWRVHDMCEGPSGRVRLICPDCRQARMVTPAAARRNVTGCCRPCARKRKVARFKSFRVHQSP